MGLTPSNNIVASSEPHGSSPRRTTITIGNGTDSSGDYNTSGVGSVGLHTAIELAVNSLATGDGLESGNVLILPGTYSLVDDSYPIIFPPRDNLTIEGAGLSTIINTGRFTVYLTPAILDVDGLTIKNINFTTGRGPALWFGDDTFGTTNEIRNSFLLENTFSNTASLDTNNPIRATISSSSNRLSIVPQPYACYRMDEIASTMTDSSINTFSYTASESSVSRLSATGPLSYTGEWVFDFTADSSHILFSSGISTLNTQFISPKPVIAEVVAGAAGTGYFEIGFDRTQLFVSGVTFTVSGTAFNDGTYTVHANGSELNGGNTRVYITTTITTSESVVGGAQIDDFSVSSTTITMLRQFAFESWINPEDTIATTPIFRSVWSQQLTTAAGTDDIYFSVGIYYSTSTTAHYAIAFRTEDNSDGAIAYTTNSFTAGAGSSYQHVVWSIDSSAINMNSSPGTALAAMSKIIVDGVNEAISNTATTVAAAQTLTYANSNFGDFGTTNNSFRGRMSHFTIWRAPTTSGTGYWFDTAQSQVRYYQQYPDRRDIRDFATSTLIRNNNISSTTTSEI